LGSGWARLRFLPGGSIEIQQPSRAGHDGGAPVQVVDASGAFAPLAGTGMVLVVRPDRYVAAAATAAGEQAALRSLGTYAPELTAVAAAAAQAG
jgi:3-(3-hydroxy-phenyl)propionate hydroxylase